MKFKVKIIGTSLFLCLMRKDGTPVKQPGRWGGNELKVFIKVAWCHATRKRLLETFWTPKENEEFSMFELKSRLVRAYSHGLLYDKPGILY